MTQIEQPSRRFMRWPKTTIHPRVQTQETVWNLVRELAHIIVETDKLNSGQTNIQAVNRLDNELLKAKEAGLITTFSIGGWRGDEISVLAYMPSEKYLQENRRQLRRRLSDALSDLSLYVGLSLRVDGEQA